MYLATFHLQTVAMRSMLPLLLLATYVGGIPDRSSFTFAVAKVEEDPRTRTWPKLTMDYIENKYRFMRYLERTEGRPILPTYL